MLSGGREAIEFLKTAPIAGTKAAIDAVLHRSPPSISFDSLGRDRFYVYLLIALTRIEVVGCPPGASLLACAWLPLADFFQNLRTNWHHPTTGALLSETAHGANVLRINRDYYSSYSEGHRLFAPYFAHPVFYISGLHDAVRGMRERKRDIKIFFAGTTSQIAYSVGFSFPILNRDQIISHVLAKFKHTIDIEFKEGRPQSILIISTCDTRDTLKKHKLKLEKYIDLMSRSDFFICPPGWSMPHSHNLIEAMSVGTIPITNYYAYMRPSLEPDLNCLAFSSIEELEKLINRALCMSAIEVQRLRGEVISYYEKHLEPKNFANKLMRCLPTISELVVNDESGR